MARKVFGESLKNAMGASAGEGQRAAAESAMASRTSPTVARAQASVMEEDKHATRLLDPGVIGMSAVMDRIDPSEGLEELVASIREHGQKVPVLVRRIPGGLFEIVYGRRRLLACRALGQKVRATVMEMSDEEALIAQGVENNARQDPSFIERALFVAGIIRELGKTEDGRKNAQTVAYRALQIDESLVSRMNRIANGIPIEMIRAIGAAHGVGRRSWEKLSKLCEADPARAVALAPEISRELPAAARLEAAIDLMSVAKPSRPAPAPSPQVRMARRGNRIILDADPALVQRLEAAIKALIEDFVEPGSTNGDHPAS